MLLLSERNKRLSLEKRLKCGEQLLRLRYVCIFWNHKFLRLKYNEAYQIDKWTQFIRNILCHIFIIAQKFDDGSMNIEPSKLLKVQNTFNIFGVSILSH